MAVLLRLLVLPFFSALTNSETGATLFCCCCCCNCCSCRCCFCCCGCCRMGCNVEKRPDSNTSVHVLRVYGEHKLHTDLLNNLRILYKVTHRE